MWTMIIFLDPVYLPTCSSIEFWNKKKSLFLQNYDVTFSEKKIRSLLKAIQRLQVKISCRNSISKSQNYEIWFS